MKKLSFLVAVLAVVFAVGSAFTTQKQKALETGYFEVIGSIAWNTAFDESDFTTTGAVINPVTSFGCLSDTPAGLVCAAHFTARDEEEPGELGSIYYKPAQ